MCCFVSFIELPTRTAALHQKQRRRRQLLHDAHSRLDAAALAGRQPRRAETGRACACVRVRGRGVQSCSAQRCRHRAIARSVGRESGPGVLAARMPWESGPLSAIQKPIIGRPAREGTARAVRVGAGPFSALRLDGGGGYEKRMLTAFRAKRMSVGLFSASIKERGADMTLPKVNREPRESRQEPKRL